MFRKPYLISSSSEEKETSTLLGPLERANFNHWTVTETQQSRCLPPLTSGRKQIQFPRSYIL
jgi:hypothetical protein